MVRWLHNQPWLFWSGPGEVPVIVILADHLEVPSRTACLMVFICWAWRSLVIPKMVRMVSKISGLLRSRIFMRSFMAVMICCVRSSAPVLELFSAAPGMMMSHSNQFNGNRCAHTTLTLLLFFRLKCKKHYCLWLSHRKYILMWVEEINRLFPLHSLSAFVSQHHYSVIQVPLLVLNVSDAISI